MAIQRRKEGSTEIETVTIKDGDPAAAVDLTNVTTAKWWQRQVGTTTNKVSGASMTVTDAANGVCTFDPAGAAVGGGDAFDAPGDYQVYIELEWSDGDETRHPDTGYELYRIEQNFE